MLTCQQVTEIVTDYLEGEMPFWQRVQFQLHIGMCRHCREYLRQMKATIETMGRLPDEPIPDDVKDELRSRLRNLSGDPDSDR
jgi:predicted anti-sigma-YlaC factor YlaD